MTALADNPVRRRSLRGAPVRTLDRTAVAARPTAGRHYNLTAVEAPARPAGDDWGADERYRPTLNGEPVPGATAASVREGWVKVAGEAFPRHGRVAFVPVPAGCR